MSKIFQNKSLAAAFFMPLFFVLLFLFNSSVFAQSSGQLSFNHSSTGFVLDGSHLKERCESCHVNGIFKATPKTCDTCHRVGGLAPGIKSNHIPTTGTVCSSCHNTVAWNPSSFKHRADQKSPQLDCATCHNGVFASSNASMKPITHPPSSNNCAACHATSSWLPAGYSHALAVPGQCATCHNGIKAMGKASTHIPTTASCDSCHFAGTTFTTLAVSMDTMHTNMQGPSSAGNCSTCHSGGFLVENAQMKPLTHISTTAQCDTCHKSTNTWATGSFDHTTASPAVTNRCVTCHNGSSALGKPTTHIPTSAQCDSCHSNFISFKPASMNHIGTTGPSANGNCATCHNGSFVIANAQMKPVTHIPTSAQCDTCHIGGYINWAPATMNHNGMTGKCISCHSGGFLSQNAQTKPVTHIGTTAQCDSCHKSTVSWAINTFNHSAASPAVTGRCSSCHNGTTALGKPTTHIPTNAQCDSCHTNFTSFNPAKMNHAGTAGTCATCHGGSFTFANAQTKPSNHIPTGAQCDTCHISGFVSWNPANMNHTGLGGLCATCHSGAFLTQNAQMKTVTHISTNQQCDTCHKSTVSWATATFNHASAVPSVTSRCSTCHNGVNALGKPTIHIPTSAQCDTCHKNYTAFAPAAMSHSGTTGPVANGNCSTCHSGTYNSVNAQMKPVTHIQTTMQCDSCHGTVAWKPTTFAHNGVVAGTCSTCHNGVNALGKPTAHIPTNASCDNCHNNYIAFSPAVMNHSGTTGPIANGNCATCHSGTFTSVNAQMKPVTHLSTTAQCDTCHKSTISWATATFVHDATSYGKCSTCHNSVNALGKPTTHIPTGSQCDTCHSNFTSFKPANMNHPGTISPVASGNCATCHNGAYNIVNALAKPVSHIPTGAQCDTCHTNGFVVWAPATMNHTGLGNQCATCHSGGFLTQNAQMKPVTHLSTSAQCDTCHKSTISWATATFNHATAVPAVTGICSTCHNGISALGKPTTHIPTSAQCDSCHKNYTAFAPAFMNHSKTTGPTSAGNCITCHSGSYTAMNAQMKPATHIPTAQSCDTCHSTSAWKPTTFAHNGVVAGTCATCHNGLSALGKPTNHIPTSATCDTCHKNYVAFAPATMTHSGTTGPVASGNCSTCHSGAYLSINAQVKTATHIVTTQQCDTCHTGAANSLSWALTTFDHSLASPSAIGRCSSCHNGSSALGKPTTHIPTSAQCDTCHTAYSSFRVLSMSHSGTTGPVASGNCSTCHSGSFISANALAKPVTHIPTSAQCDSCHINTVSFIPATMVHSKTLGPVATANCTTCHSGAYLSQNAQVKTATHISTVQQCDTCHTNASNSLSWALTTFDHSLANPSATGRCSSCHNGVNALGKPTTHIPTSAQCDTCHKNYSTFAPAVMNHPGTTGPVAAGTCSTCHNGIYSSINAQTKPVTHIPTSKQCDTCHTGGFTSFNPANMNHTGTAGTCSTCHSGSYLTQNAQTKPTTHMPTTAQCDTCHNSTVSWATGTFNHATAVPAVANRCSTCHNSVNALGKPTTHIPTSAQCDTCHKNFLAFAPATMSHTGTAGPLAANNCKTCHSGSYTAVNAQKQSGTHIPTTQSCDVCHTTTAWTPTSFAHVGVVTGQCSTCHNGINATGKPTVHIPTTLSCDSCHKTGISWLPLKGFAHTGVTTNCASCHSSSYPSISSKLSTNHMPTNATCESCHKSTIVWLPVTYNHSGVAVGTCATCHGGSYTGVTVKVSNHIPTTIPTGSIGNECSNCHSSTSTFLTEKMKHGTMTTSCITCHDSSAAYLGNMFKITRGSGHHNSTGKDCSSSGCHKPLGSIGSSYTKWN